MKPIKANEAIAENKANDRIDNRNEASQANMVNRANNKRSPPLSSCEPVLKGGSRFRNKVRTTNFEKFAMTRK